MIMIMYGFLHRCAVCVCTVCTGQRYLVLYASTLIDIGNIMLSEGEAAVSIKTFSLALTLLRAVHGDNQVQVSVCVGRGLRACM